MCSQINVVTRFSQTTLDVAWFERTSVACENLVIASSHVLREIECAVQ